jgi:hypothetical protein
MLSGRVVQAADGQRDRTRIRMRRASLPEQNSIARSSFGLGPAKVPRIEPNENEPWDKNGLRQTLAA